MKSRIGMGALLLVMLSRVVAGTIEVPDRDPDARARGELPPQMRVVETVAPWLRKTQHNDVVYFLYSFPGRVARYSLTSSSWLSDIPLSAVPRGIAVSAAGIFVNQNTKVSRFSLDGSAETVLTVPWSNADDIAIIGDYLLTSRKNPDQVIQSVRLSTMTQVAVYSGVGGYNTPIRMSVAAQAGVIFGWQVGVSPSDILRIPLQANGTFGPLLSSPYHGTYPAGTVTYTEPAGTVVIDDSGIAFSGTDLLFRSGSGGPVNDVVFAGTNRYVLHDRSVARLDANFRELGSVDLSTVGNAIAVANNNVYVFREDSPPSAVEIIPISAFSNLQTGQAPDPLTVPFIADYADLADDGMLYLFNRAQRVVHRFSVPLWRYLPSVALPNNPTFAAVDRAGSRVYIAYDDGRLGVIPAGATQEQFLAYGPVGASGLGALDGIAMTSDTTGAWASHRFYNSAGTETDWREWNYFSREYSWSRATRRLYFFRDDTSPNDIHFEEISLAGVRTADGESPFHGEVIAQTPIRPNPNGSQVYIGSGQVFDALSLNIIGTLPLPPLDAAWMGSSLYTLAEGSQSALKRLIRWNFNNTIASEGVLAAEQARAFVWGAQVITVARVNGTTRIQRWPGLLSGTNLVVTLVTQPQPVAPGAPLTFSVSVTNMGLQPVAGAALNVLLSYPVDLLTWACQGPQGAFNCGSPTGLSTAFGLAPGQTVQATAFGNMPTVSPRSIQVNATISTVPSDLDPSDNAALGTIELDDLLLRNGFE